ncbi:hypothetical protein HOD29_03255 [archaeon]|jgi:hypothetical protein|nr:hypothetical protein [archaeon]
MRRPDNKTQLAEYFKRNLSKNYTPDTLKFALTSQGYSRVIVNEAFEQASKELAEKAPVLKEKPVIKYELYDHDNKPLEIEPLTFWEKVKFFFKGRKF